METQQSSETAPRVEERIPRRTTERFSSPGRLHIRLLGDFTVSVDAQPVSKQHWRHRKAATLIKRLALAERHRLHREQVLDLLWPELDSPAASNNLHYTLYVARRILDPDRAQSSSLLRLQTDLLTLAPPDLIWVDVDAFEAAALTAHRNGDATAYRSALAAYGGELLPEDRYEDWAEERREPLRRLYHDLLLTYARLLEQDGELPSATETLTQAIADEPLLEEAHLALVRLYARAGRRQQAIRQYEQLRQIMKESLGTEPDPAAQELYREILAGRVPIVASSPTLVEKPPAPRHNLPSVLTSVVGRTNEQAVIQQLLRTTRLVTLIGAGGVGKTCLAQTVARELVDRYPDGIWLVELAPLTDGSLLERTLASVLGIQVQPGAPLLAPLSVALGDRRVLLVLDNCEHVINACAGLVESILGACPQLHILATSREPLGAAGETIFTVPPLELPREEQTLPELAQQEAVQLFVERTRERQPAFLLSEQNAAAVIRICRGLDGLPLALELAAARTSVLAPEQIADRLSNTLDLLTGGSRLASPRQRTVRGAIDWSYQLLDDEEQHFFRRLAVFAGGWTLEAAEVLGTTSSVGGDILDLLSHLVDKSLVVVEPSGASLRYRFLEPIRQYARERLESKEADEIRHRHAALFQALSEDAGPRLDGPEQDVWLGRLAVEHDNIRAALQWMLEHGQEEGALRLSSAIWRFWATRSYPGEGRQWLDRALMTGTAATAARVRALTAAGTLARIQSDYPAARRLLGESLTLARQLGQRDAAMRSLAALGTIAAQQGDYAAARASLEESLALGRSLGDTEGIASALNILGIIAKQQGEYERASQLYVESLVLSRQLGNKRQIAKLLSNLGVVAQLQTELQKARGLLEESLTLFRELDDKDGLGMVLHNLGVIAKEQHEYAQASILYTESLSLSREMGDKHNTVKSLITLGTLRLLDDDPQGARVWYAEALELCRDLGDKEVTAYCLEGLAAVLRADAEPSRAVCLWAAAAALRDAIGAPLSPNGQLHFEQNLATARQALGDERFAAAWSEGGAMDMDQALMWALHLELLRGRTVNDDPIPEKGCPTARERQVAVLITQSLTNRQIARQLGISERTVETHVSKILHKLGFASRAQVAAWATERELA